MDLCLEPLLLGTQPDNLVGADGTGAGCVQDSHCVESSIGNFPSTVSDTIQAATVEVRALTSLWTGEPLALAQLEPVET